MDVYCDEDGFVIEMALPGVDPEKIDVSIEGNQVSICGTMPEPSDERRYLLHERPVGHFERTIQFPSELDAENAEAHCEYGLIRLKVPRAEAARPRRIQVGAGRARKETDKRSAAAHRERDASAPPQEAGRGSDQGARAAADGQRRTGAGDGKTATSSVPTPSQGEGQPVTTGAPRTGDRNSAVAGTRSESHGR